MWLISDLCLPRSRTYLLWSQNSCHHRQYSTIFHNTSRPLGIWSFAVTALWEPIEHSIVSSQHERKHSIKAFNFKTSIDTLIFSRMKLGMVGHGHLPFTVFTEYSRSRSPPRPDLGPICTRVPGGTRQRETRQILDVSHLFLSSLMLVKPPVFCTCFKPDLHRSLAKAAKKNWMQMTWLAWHFE